MSDAPILCAKCGKRFVLVPAELRCPCGSTQFKHELSDKPLPKGEPK